MQISNAAPRSALVLRRDQAARRCFSDLDWIFQFALRFARHLDHRMSRARATLSEITFDLPLIWDFGGSRRDASCPKHPRSFAIPIGNISLPTQHIGVRKRRVLEGAGASDFERKNSFAGPEWCAAVAETELPPQRFRRQRCFYARPCLRMLPVKTLCYVCEWTARAIQHTMRRLGRVRKGATPHAPFLTSRLAELVRRLAYTCRHASSSCRFLLPRQPFALWRRHHAGMSFT
jgi:hypothetical protein